MESKEAFYPVRGVVTIGRGNMSGTSKVTIPIEIMQRLNLHVGDNLTAHVDAEGRIVFARLVR
jgi:antitoxin component of MazEF toxin-antitoxin module